MGASLKGLFKRNKLRDGQPVTEKIIRLPIEKGRRRNALLQRDLVATTDGSAYRIS